MSSIDRASGVETPEDEHPHDRHPPPPPEQPGSGLPSRAETHKAAAEFDAQDDQPASSEQPTDEFAGEQDSKATAESSAPPESVDTSGEAGAEEEEQTTTEGAGTHQDDPVTPGSWDGSGASEPAPANALLGEDRPTATDSLAEEFDTQPAADLGSPSDVVDAESGPQESQTADMPAERPESSVTVSDAPAAEPEDKSGREYMLGDRLVRPPEGVDLVWGPPVWSDGLGREPTAPALASIDQGNPEGQSKRFDGFGEEPTDPADRPGDRIADSENDEQSRSERLRKKFYEESEDVRDGVRKTSDRVQDLLPSRPPTGHPEARTRPIYSQAAHHGVDAGDTATALLAAGFVIVEGGRWISGKLNRGRKGHNDGGD